MINAVKIILIEDHPEYREVIELALSKSKDLKLVAQFGTAEMALRSMQSMETRTDPDIILLDLNLPGMSGHEAIPFLKNFLPHSKIIVLTQSDREQDVLTAIRLGANGYLLKSSTVSNIKEAIRMVMKGGASLDAAVAGFILKSLKENLPQPQQKPSLSQREMEVITLLAEGLSKKQIAHELGIRDSTVVTHVGHIYEKLNAVNAPAAINRAHKLGLFRKE